MIKNYLKIALANLMKNKFYSMINIVGLAIGITACILIMLYVQSELSYDTYHEKADRIYRVNLDAVINGDDMNSPVTCPPLAKAMQNEIPEVEEAARITYQPAVIRHNNDVLMKTVGFLPIPIFQNLFHYFYYRQSRKCFITTQYSGSKRNNR